MMKARMSAGFKRITSIGALGALEYPLCARAVFGPGTVMA
jgi:hypothetical protein